MLVVGSTLPLFAVIHIVQQYIYTITMCFSQSQRSLLPLFTKNKRSPGRLLRLSFSKIVTLTSLILLVKPFLGTYIESDLKKNALTSLDNGHIMFMSFITNLYVYTMYILRFLFNLNNLERFCMLYR